MELVIVFGIAGAISTAVCLAAPFLKNHESCKTAQHEEE